MKVWAAYRRWVAVNMNFEAEDTARRLFELGSCVGARNSKTDFRAIVSTRFRRHANPNRDDGLVPTIGLSLSARDPYHRPCFVYFGTRVVQATRALSATSQASQGLTSLTKHDTKQHLDLALPIDLFPSFGRDVPFCSSFFNPLKLPSTLLN